MKKVIKNSSFLSSYLHPPLSHAQSKQPFKKKSVSLDTYTFSHGVLNKNLEHFTILDTVQKKSENCTCLLGTSY